MTAALLWMAGWMFTAGVATGFHGGTEDWTLSGFLLRFATWPAALGEAVGEFMRGRRR